jgi:hypothetical protein
VGDAMPGDVIELGGLVAYRFGLWRLPASGSASIATYEVLRTRTNTN